ncbi:ubiquinone/menaquinone biosynthesis C-methylase UbiE [Nocardioides daedukensis]|uniref:Ubiquinone/menaquinone biosynthesis C-methylase UbiE n=1 Tax=Nocardioides daedukensis TaxID=634462 RepID=A0A7Y9S4M7_9ACTN|nr:class I SAM-dependent methyltransferase [Nocardioides daedukensis]NYG59330.1 ubiquinone/menaquinone biosynthesis C-methylase UbiE [Nocardioides daedukensis]
MDETARFNEEAATWDTDPDKVRRATDVAEVVRHAVPLRGDMRALEIGGGTGLLARALADDLDTVLVTDVAPGMVAAAARVLDDPRYAGWESRLYDIEHDPLPEERFDLVLGQLALHHMGDVASVVRRCAQVLRPGGWIALVDLDHDPHGDFHASVHDFHGHDGFTRAEVTRWLSESGFTDISMTDAGAVTKDVGGEDRDFPMFLAAGRRDR